MIYDLITQIYHFFSVHPSPWALYLNHKHTASSLQEELTVVFPLPLIFLTCL